ncbi:MAG TPA: energy transducer TonB, partial [Holophagaceae bacterium]|nr:energy transducer TonB [Holophagaceae bacterium]
MTTLTLQPGLRPAPLPPTLQPHAVLSLAPPTDWRRSAAVSVMVYAILGGGLFWMAHAGVVAIQKLPPTIGPVVLNEAPPTTVRTVAPAHPVVATKAPDVPVIARTAPSDAIPETPASLPTQNLSNDPPTAPPTNPATGPATASGPISLSGDAVHVLYQVNPVYPPLAMAAHLQGQVVIRMTIDERGLPSDVQAVSGIP